MWWSTHSPAAPALAEKTKYHLTKVATWLLGLARAAKKNSIVTVTDSDLCMAAREVHKMSSTANNWSHVKQPKQNAIVERGVQSAEGLAAQHHCNL